MILSAIAERLKRRSKDDFKGRHFKASLILQAVCCYLRYPLSYRDIEELFRERGLAVDHSTLNRWVLAYAPLIERRLRYFRKPHCGSIRIDETYIKIRGQWRGPVANSGIGYTGGGTDPSFMLCWPPADQNRPRASGSARTPSTHPRSRTLSATTAWPRTLGSFVALYGRTESRRSAASTA